MARQNTDDRTVGQKATRADERRRHERVPASLAVSFGGSGAPGGTIMSESINISAGGLYFRADRAIEVETILAMTLVLPPTSARTGEQAINVTGVVVRSEPERHASGRNFYSVACFFLDISDADRAVLEDYIQSRANRA